MATMSVKASRLAFMVDNIQADALATEYEARIAKDVLLGDPVNPLLVANYMALSAPKRIQAHIDTIALIRGWQRAIVGAHVRGESHNRYDCPECRNA